MNACSLEVPIDTLEQARIAAPHADRLEVCDDLASEGWSPTPELLQAVTSAVAGTKTEVVALVRPRPEDGETGLSVEHFLASTTVIDAALQTIDDAAQAGADAVAVGLLLPDGRIDVDSCDRLHRAAADRGLAVSFLRMFDLVPDRTEAIRTLTDLGFRRILTAGTRGWSTEGASIEDRIEVLRSDVATAERATPTSPVQIVAAGGVRSGNARAFMAATPHLHSSGRIDHGPDESELARLAHLARESGA